MGLDIAAFSNATLVTDHAPLSGEWCEDVDHVPAYLADDSFWRSGRGLVIGSCYDVTASASDGFRAGSYGGYNMWRDDLTIFALGVSARAVWADPERYADKPFFELINFSDCEGTIGPEAAADLLKDFLDFRGRYAKTHDTFDVDRYENWLHACELAGAGGLIHFG